MIKNYVAVYCQINGNYNKLINIVFITLIYEDIGMLLLWKK